VRSTVDRVMALVDATPPSTVITVRGGTIGLDDYLTTRVLELVVHTDDLCRALGRDAVASGDQLRSVLATIVGGLDAARGLVVMRALMGRATLPADFNLFG
jgi:hypothetical protein